MIDIETEVFDRCARAVLAKFPDALVSSVNVFAPASFPAVSIAEGNNMTDSTRVDSSGIEKGAVIAFDVRVFSNLRQGARTQAKAMAQEVDAVMTSLNFTRAFKSQGGMKSDPSIYQVTLRYQAGVDQNGKIYRR